MKALAYWDDLSEGANTDKNQRTQNLERTSQEETRKIIPHI